MPSPIRLVSSSCLVAALVLVAVAPAGSAAAAPTTCSVRGKERKLGATYVTALTVRGVSCAAGERVVRAFQRCRRAKGVRGRCTRRVLRYSCTETRPSDETIPTQFTGHVTCTRGSRRVSHVYQQNT